MKKVIGLAAGLLGFATLVCGCATEPLVPKVKAPEQPIESCKAKDEEYRKAEVKKRQDKKEETDKEQAPLPELVRYDLFPTRAHEASMAVETNISTTQLGDKPLVAMSVVPKASFDIGDKACTSTSHYIDVEVPIGYSLNEVTKKIGTSFKFGNPSLGWHKAIGSLRSNVVMSVGARLTLPFNDGEPTDNKDGEPTDNKDNERANATENSAASALSASQSGYDVHRFSSAFFVVGLPLSLEFVLKQLRFAVDATPTFFFPTFARFRNEWTRVGLTTALDAAFRTEGPTFRVLVGVRGQLFLISEAGSSSLAVSALEERRGGLDIQSDWMQVAVEPYIAIDTVNIYLRIGAIIPATRPLALGINANDQLGIRSTLGWRF